MKRFVTAAIAAPLALAMAFLLPTTWFFVLIAAVISIAGVELVALARAWAPRAPLAPLPLAAVALAAVLALPAGPLSQRTAIALWVALAIGGGTLVLLGRTPVAETLPALGALAFGVPYIALPIASLTLLQRASPWMVVLLVAIVWTGDTTAYYIGRRWGRRKLAPTVSPNKTWEGAAASLGGALVVTVLWSLFYLGRLSPGVLGAAVATALAAQVGDLMESLLKRGAGVKDSGNLLPGHGGLLDRADALFFAAPVFWLAIELLAPELLVQTLQ